MIYFLTNLTILKMWLECHRFSVRNVRFSDKSDCAYGEKSNYLSLYSPKRVFPTRARKQICQKAPRLAKWMPAVLKTVSA